MTTGGSALPAMDHAGRRDRLRALLVEAGCDHLLVTRPVDVRYLTGFTGSNGSLLVGREAGEDVLVTDARYRERLAGLDVARTEVARPVAAVVADLGTAAVGVDADHVTLAQAERLERARGDVPLLRTVGLVALLRTTKDAGEVARLRRACKITTDVLRDLAEDGLMPGTSEQGLARAIERAFVDRGADGVAFPTIVAAGTNGASPHHEPASHRLAVGELVTIDCGAEVDGYRADMTRTLAVGGWDAVPPRLREVHGVVVAANAAGRAAARVDGPVAEVDRAARRTVADAGYADAFVHPTGHGIGLDVHESPLVTDPSAGSLPPGTTFTVEPGIYLPGVGGVRIEDSLVVLEDTVDVMTDLERGPTTTRSDGA